MARKPKPKPQAEPVKPFEEFVDESEGLDDDDAEEPVEVTAASRSRDWRDVERYREMRELRKLVGDDIDFDVEIGSRRR